MVRVIVVLCLNLCMQDCVMGIVLHMTVHKCECLCCEMYLSGCGLSLKGCSFDVVTGVRRDFIIIVHLNSNPKISDL